MYSREERVVGFLLSCLIFNNSESIHFFISAMQMYNVPVTIVDNFCVTVQRHGEAGYWLVISRPGKLRENTEVVHARLAFILMC